MAKYNFTGIADAAANTADWGHSGCYTQTLLDRDTLEVWTVTHVSENNWCQIKDPAVTVVIGSRKKVTEQRMQQLCEEAMDRWQDIKAAWDKAGCNGSYCDECYTCPYLNLCANR